MVSVDVDEEEKSARVVVPDYQLSLAIGKEGQNARLAAKLTGYKIDIKSESQARELEEEMDFADDFAMEDDADLLEEEMACTEESVEEMQEIHEEDDQEWNETVEEESMPEEIQDTVEE